jgi:hypothetical protein
MNKEEAINIINTTLKEHFDYVSLDTTLKITEALIEKGVIKVEVEGEHNLRVCDHCLAAIQSREGYLPTITLYVDEEDPVASKCEWCEEEGFDTLYELI